MGVAISIKFFSSKDLPCDYKSKLFIGRWKRKVTDSLKHALVCSYFQEGECKYEPKRNI